MDDEGRRLAALSDEEWAAHVRGLEQAARSGGGGGLGGGRGGADRSGANRRRSVLIASLVLAGGLAVVAAVVLPHRHSGGPASSAPAAPAVLRPLSESPAAHWGVASVALTMPAPIQEGPYSPAEVKAALARARTFLLTARTDPAVLYRHDVSRLKTLVAPFMLRPSYTQGQPMQTVLDATFLGPGNTLTDPVRLAGSVSMAYRAQNDQAGERLTVTANLVWAYGLKADYPVARVPFRVVAVHEKTELDFYLDTTMDGPAARPVISSAHRLWIDMDCGYLKQDLLALPRTNDPDAVSGDPVSDPSAAFDPNAPLTSDHACRK